MKIKNTRVTWLTEEGESQYDVFQKNGRASWTIFFRNTRNTKPETVESPGVKDPELALPYTCSMSECKTYSDHTLYCLIAQIVNAAPSKKSHIERICSQLSKVNDMYYEMPVWELQREIIRVVQVEDSSIRFENDFCYLKYEYPMGIKKNDIPCTKDLAKEFLNKYSSNYPRVVNETKDKGIPEKMLTARQYNLAITNDDVSIFLEHSPTPKSVGDKEFASQNHAINESSSNVAPINFSEIFPYENNSSNSWICGDYNRRDFAPQSFPMEDAESDKSTPELVIDEDARSEVSIPEEPMVNPINEFINSHVPQSRVEENIPNKDHLLDSIINCFSQVRSISLSSLDIYSIMTLTDPNQYSDDMIENTLIKNKKIFKMEKKPGQSYPNWILKTFPTKVKRKRRARQARKEHTLTWKQMIVEVLGSEKLTRAQIEQRVYHTFNSMSGKWRHSIYVTLSQYKCFKQFGEMWFIEEKDRQGIVGN